MQRRLVIFLNSTQVFLKSILVLAIALAPALVFAPQLAAAASPKTIVLTSGSTWTVPSDWNNSANTIEVIGGGGAGQSATRYEGGAGGGGGAYSKMSNLTLTKGATVIYSIGSGGILNNSPSANYPISADGTAGSGGNTWFNGTSYAGASVAAQGGWGGGTGAGDNIGGTGGAAGSGIGTVRNSGGSGASESIPASSCLGNVDNCSGAGGGGAAGPNGSGLAGNPNVYYLGGAGDAGYGGAPVDYGSANGSEMSGGVGAGSGGGSAGDDAFASPYGCGGPQPGSPGGSYGAGGGGGAQDSGNNCGNGSAGGTGAQGVIVITYTPQTSNCPTAIGVPSSNSSAFDLIANLVSRLVSAVTLNFCVSNTSSNHYFIPAKTTTELQSFYSAANAGKLSGVSVFAP